MLISDTGIEVNLGWILIVIFYDRGDFDDHDDDDGDDGDGGGGGRGGGGGGVVVLMVMVIIMMTTTRIRSRAIIDDSGEHCN